MSYHAHYIEDGQLVDEVRFCSDSCHRDWCADQGVEYAGWSGCHELEFTDYCAQCGVVLPGLEDACEHQLGNVVVNRFRSDEGERCDHGNWLQVPECLMLNVPANRYADEVLP